MRTAEELATRAERTPAGAGGKAGGRWTWAAPVALVLVTAFLVEDLFYDAGQESSSLHLALDVLALVIACAGLAGTVEYFRGRRSRAP